MKKGKYSFLAVWIGIVLCGAFSVHHYVKRDTPLITVWDAYGYYVYLPAVFTFHDLREFAFVENHFAEYPMQSGMYQLADTGIGGPRIPIYTAGMAVVWSPFYLVAEGIAMLSNHPRDGLSPPYQWSILFAALFFGLLGLIFLRRLLLRYVPDKMASIAIIAVLFGTNYFHYLCYDPGMPHSYLFAGHVCLLYCTDSWFRTPRMRFALVAGAALTILCLIRPTELLAVLVPVTYALVMRSQFHWKRRHFQHLAGFGLIAVLLIIPQLLLWHANTGNWIFDAYTNAGHTFHFDGRYLLDGLFSYRKGWFVYTPLMLMAIAGIVLMRGTMRKWRLPLAIVLVAHVYITFSWHWWWYANSFGSRPMIHLYPELSLALAALIVVVWKNTIVRTIMLCLIGGCLMLNQFQIWQYNHGVLPGDGINKHYYWLAFGKTKVARTELKYLYLPGRLRHREQYTTSIIAESRILTASDVTDGRQFRVHEGNASQLLTPDVTYSKAAIHKLDSLTADQLNGQWVQSSAELWITGESFNSSRNAQLILEGQRDGVRLFWQNMSFQIFADIKKWTTVDWEYQLPEDLQAGDVVKAYIWNKSPDSIYVHSISLSVLTR